MKVLVTGGTGALGKELVWALLRKNHEVVVLTRQLTNASEPSPVRYVTWPLANDEDERRLLDVDAVIHLAGESLMAGRWTSRQKEKIYSSRVGMTEELVGLFKKSTRLKIFLSGSAIGFYGDRKTELLTEDSNRGEGFLADLCSAWEKAANVLRRPGLRVVNLRTGVVLQRGSGFLKQVEPIYQMWAGGPLGSGKQILSWIHIHDWLQAVVFLLESRHADHAYNLVAPEPISFKSFSYLYAKIFRQPMQLPVPSLAVKFALGEMSEAVLGGQNVRPVKLLAETGFKFQFPYLEQALDDVYELERFENQTYDYFKTEIWLDKKLDVAFSFFSDEKNLEAITPEFLNFKVLQKSTERIMKGTLIDYSLKIHGLPSRWQTKITEWNPPHQFVDTQSRGPYSFWNHTHKFEALAGGTLITDTVHYKLPLRFLGRALGMWWVKNDVEKIFSFRAKTLRELWHS